MDYTPLTPDELEARKAAYAAKLEESYRWKVLNIEKCAQCGGSHEVCAFASGSLLCAKEVCRNPHCKRVR